MISSNCSKWILLGRTKEERRRVYELSRIKAYTILKNKHKREYSKILNKLIKNEEKKLMFLIREKEK